MARSAAFAGLQRAGLVAQAERARGLARHAGEALVDRHAEQRRRHVHGQQQRGQRRGAGIAVGGDRHRHAVLAEQLDRRLLRLADEVEGAGQDAPRPCRPWPWRPRRPRRYIRDGRPTARHSSAASAAPPRLDSWSACSLTGRPSALAASNTRAICSGEKAMPSQKPSTASARPSAGDRRQHLVDDLGRCRRPCRPSTSGGSGMGAEEGRADRHGALVAEPARGAQHLRLVLEVEPVAGLDLDRGDALGDQRVEPRQRLARQARPRSAARSACTEETMPPPARAISS